MDSIKEMTATCFLPDGTYTLRLMAPKGTPEHTITFKLENGVYRAEIQTEHGPQTAKHLKIQEHHILWQQFGGTPGTELFQYDMEIFPGNLLMGKCHRIDVPAEEAPASPVIAEPVQ